MWLMNISAISRVSTVTSTLPHQAKTPSSFSSRKSRSFNCKRSSAPQFYKSHFVTCSALGDENSPLGLDVPFPRDYSELIEQAKEAAVLAFKDEKPLMEIEFPTAGLESVPGDGEGGIEMTGSMQMIREFCDCFITSEKVTRTRIFFPEAKEVEFARKSIFEGASFKLDYLTKPSFFEDFGFVEKVKMSDRVKPQDETFVVAYPYFNVNEILVVEELYKEAVEKQSRKMIIFNGELDRIRSGCILFLYAMISVKSVNTHAASYISDSCSATPGYKYKELPKLLETRKQLAYLTKFSSDYPPFFYPKLGALTKTFLPKVETIYYIHNFKGRNGGTLFRCYPGPWKVLRQLNGKYVCLHQQKTMPSLKEVALDILTSTQSFKSLL
ncbi:hypothetical protein C5167_049422 [Papaver somniferum]|uniref:DUF1995 domain-containing protein n=1 Tax=Papaver somniferum TaxID=3469 RepID=A0A4Y7KP57_PAPSO|nr:hypothetical protein C5167_049422 [Papaver somniferum]